DGYVSGDKQRFSLHVDVTPNHHEIAEGWSFGDNFYVDSDYSAAGLRRLTGACPDWWSETALLYQEAGNRAVTRANESPAVWNHLTRHKIDFRSFGADEPDFRISDQRRANEFIASIRNDYLEAGKPLPRFLLLNLPADTTGPPRPADGYRYRASYVADNDYA